jgi:hypothetical protein
LPLGQPTVGKNWLQTSGSNRAETAYETAEDASPHVCRWWRTRVTHPARVACKAMLRSCAIPVLVPLAGVAPARVAASASEADVSSSFTTTGITFEAGAIARFRSGTSAFTARDADHYTTIAIVVWSGWLVSIQRPPASETGTLPAELHPGIHLVAALGFSPRTYRLGDRSRCPGLSQPKTRVRKADCGCSARRRKCRWLKPISEAATTLCARKRPFPSGWAEMRRLLCRTTCEWKHHSPRRPSRIHPHCGPTHLAF